MQHIFLTRNGVYALVFDMSKLVGPLSSDAIRLNALAFMRFWLRQIHLLAKGAPVVVVGTHKDLVPDAASHVEISNMLDATFGLGDEAEIWRKCERNEDEEGGELCFFPVDNSDPSDVNITRLRRFIERGWKTCFVCGGSYLTLLVTVAC